MNQGKNQIGILGGSFDPVHMGHIGLAQETHERFRWSRFYFYLFFNRLINLIFLWLQAPTVWQC